MIKKFFVIFVLIIAVQLAGAVPIEKCGQLHAGSYELIRDVFAEDTCFEIVESKVSLDCQGNTIYYAQKRAGNGIYANSVSNISIINCRISQGSFFDDAHAINFFSVSDFLIRNNTIETQAIRTGSDGIHLEDNTRNGNVLDNTITTLVGNGIYLGDTNAIDVENNIITSQTYEITHERSFKVFLRRNTIGTTLPTKFDLEYIDVVTLPITFSVDDVTNPPPDPSGTVSINKYFNLISQDKIKMNIKIYYSDNEIPPTTSETSLVIFKYSNGEWLHPEEYAEDWGVDPLENYAYVINAFCLDSEIFGLFGKITQPSFTVELAGGVTEINFKANLKNVEYLEPANQNETVGMVKVTNTGTIPFNVIFAIDQSEENIFLKGLDRYEPHNAIDIDESGTTLIHNLQPQESKYVWLWVSWYDQSPNTIKRRLILNAQPT